MYVELQGLAHLRARDIGAQARTLSHGERQVYEGGGLREKISSARKGKEGVQKGKEGAQKEKEIGILRHVRRRHQALPRMHSLPGLSDVCITAFRSWGKHQVQVRALRFPDGGKRSFDLLVHTQTSSKRDVREYADVKLRTHRSGLAKGLIQIQSQVWCRWCVM